MARISVNALLTKLAKAGGIDIDMIKLRKVIDNYDDVFLRRDAVVSLAGVLCIANDDAAVKRRVSLSFMLFVHCLAQCDRLRLYFSTISEC